MSFRKMEVLLPGVPWTTAGERELIINTPSGVTEAICIIDVTADPDLAVVTVEYQIWDPAIQDFPAVRMTNLAHSDLASVFTSVVPIALNVDRTGSLLATRDCNMPVPVRWRILFDHADTDSITYNVSIHWIARGGA